MTMEAKGKLALRLLPTMMPQIVYKVETVRHSTGGSLAAFIHHKPVGTNMVAYLQQPKPYPSVLVLGPPQQCASQAFVILPGLPQQHVCNQKRSSSLDQEEPEPPQIKEEQEEPKPSQIKEEQEELKSPQIKEEQEELKPPQIKEEQEELKPPQVKEEQEELCIAQEEEQLVLKQETDTFMWTPTYEKSGHSEDQTLYFNRAKTKSTAEKESVVNTAVVTSVSNIHCNIHSDKKSFKCYTCGKAKSSFSAHGMTYTRKKPFNCEICGRGFNRMSHLKSHMIIHTGEKPFNCEICGRRFSHMSNLKTHMLIHTGERPFACKACGQRFTQMTNLRSHILIHTGEKPFACKTCGQRFNHVSNLKTHMSLHTGGKPLVCKTCRQ